MYKVLAQLMWLMLGVLVAGLNVCSAHPGSFLGICLQDTVLGKKTFIADSNPGALKANSKKNNEAGYDISKSLPVDFVKDASVDYTPFLQQAVSLHDNIIFPAFPILINDDGIKVGSNKILNFLPGSKLVLKPSNKKGYNIIKLEKSSNVTINNPVIVGDRQTHIGTAGEFGMGIGIYSSSNITINNPQISYCWGDGIYLAGNREDQPVNNTIRILNAKLLHNRRNGISIISVNQLLMASPYVAFSDGIAPMCGIDFEPNSPADELKNITVLNAVTESNMGPGISIGLRNLYGRNNAEVDIQLVSPKDNGSAIGLKATAIFTRRAGSEIINGNINVSNPVWSKNSNTPMSINLLDENIKLTIKKPTILDPAGRPLNNKAALDNLTYKTHLNRNANCSITF